MSLKGKKVNLTVTLDVYDFTEDYSGVVVDDTEDFIVLENVSLDNDKVYERVYINKSLVLLCLVEKEVMKNE